LCYKLHGAHTKMLTGGGQTCSPNVAKGPGGGKETIIRTCLKTGGGAVNFAKTHNQRRRLFQRQKDAWTASTSKIKKSRIKVHMRVPAAGEKQRRREAKIKQLGERGPGKISPPNQKEKEQARSSRVPTEPKYENKNHQRQKFNWGGPLAKIPCSRKMSGRKKHIKNTETSVYGEKKGIRYRKRSSKPKEEKGSYVGRKGMLGRLCRERPGIVMSRGRSQESL